MIVRQSRPRPPTKGTQLEARLGHGHCRMRAPDTRADAVVINVVRRPRAATTDTTNAISAHMRLDVMTARSFARALAPQMCSRPAGGACILPETAYLVSVPPPSPCCTEGLSQLRHSDLSVCRADCVVGKRREQKPTKRGAMRSDAGVPYAVRIRRRSTRVGIGQRLTVIRCGTQPTKCSSRSAAAAHPNKHPSHGLPG